MRIIINYSRTSWYGHLSNKDTSMLRTVSNVPTKFAYIFFKKTSIIRTLTNTDKGHKISAPEFYLVKTVICLRLYLRSCICTQVL